MDLINIKARVPDVASSPLLTATKSAVIIGFHIVNITGADSTVDVFLRRSGSNTYIIKDYVVSGSDPYNPLKGRFILQEDDEIYVKSLDPDKADCFISYCEIDPTEGTGGGGYDPRLPVIAPGQSHFFLRATIGGDEYELAPTTEVFPEFTSPADDGKFLGLVGGEITWLSPLPDIGIENEGNFLSVDGGEAVWVPEPNSLPDIEPEHENHFLAVEGGEATWIPEPNSLPDITIEDEDRLLAVVMGEAVWIDAPSSLPDIEVESEGKALAVVDGQAKWCDPLEELGIGTGFFELDEEMNIVPKAKSQLYSEINLGSGHFEFTGEGDLRMKSGGDYRVGSTLPEHNTGDEGKVLKIVDGSPKWTTL